jgi:hypothetical protein
MVAGLPTRDSLLPILLSNFKGKSSATYSRERNAWLIKFPEKFCLINNSRETLDVIYSLVECYSNGATSFFFDQSKCDEIGIAASALFDIVALEIRNELRRRKLNFVCGGFLPDDPRAANLIKRMGITRHLKVPGTQLPSVIHDSFVVFDLFEGRKPVGSDLMRTTTQEIAASNLVRFLDKCLKLGKYELKVPDQRQILKWVGEIITNAEDHSGEGKWYVIACLCPCESGDSIYECQIGIINFGRSIYESLNNANTPRQTLIQIKDVADRHLSRNFFHKQEYEPQDLWTLYALQDGVSRFSVRPGDSTRGKGTVDMIEAFQYLGRTNTGSLKPRMSLVSGSSLILFDEKYRMKSMIVDQGSRKIIAFNEANSLDDKPDKDNVSSLGAALFPGTVLSFRFYIDHKHLASLNS